MSWVSIDYIHLKNEYVTFSKNLHQLINGMNVDEVYQNQQLTNDTNSDYSETDSEMSDNNSDNSSNKVTILDILKILTIVLTIN